MHFLHEKLIIIGSISAIIGCLLMISYDKKNVKSLNLIIEAIHNKDYTFRLSKKEILFNSLFNEILEILQSEKNTATQQETLIRENYQQHKHRRNCRKQGLLYIEMQRRGFTPF